MIYTTCFGAKEERTHTKVFAIAGGDVRAIGKSNPIKLQLQITSKSFRPLINESKDSQNILWSSVRGTVIIKI